MDTGFTPDNSPLRRANSLVRRWIGRNEAATLSPAEFAWLYEHPTLWLRGLQQIRREAADLQAEANGRLRDLRRAHDGRAVPEYLEAKKPIDQEIKARNRFLTIIEQYIAEVASICGPNVLHAGDVIQRMTEVAGLLDGGDLEGGLDLLIVCLERWEKDGAGMRVPAHLAVKQ